MNVIPVFNENDAILSAMPLLVNTEFIRAIAWQPMCSLVAIEL